MFRSAFLILSGNAATSLLLLARNLIIARLIPVADYGVAATFAMVMAVVEMMSALGLQQQIIQAREGEDPRFQAALQGFQVLRGVLASLAMLLIARPVATFLGVPEAGWAYQLLAIVPLANALVHFDIHRLNRHMRFWPMLLTGGIPALLSVLVVWPLMLWFGDWRVMLYAILVQAVLGAVVSHLLAERPYRLVLDREVMGNSLRFGWPLLVNGFVLYLVFQGDKLIVGRFLGMEALAVFAMGVTLTLTPTQVFARSAQNLFLPKLSRADRPALPPIAFQTFTIHFLFGAAMVWGAMVAGPPAIHLLLGPKYDDLIPYLPWLAAMQALRVYRGGPATVALSQGQTENALIANLMRVALLVVAWFAVAHKPGLEIVTLLAVVGEALGTVIAFLLVRWRLGLSMRPILASMVPACAITLLAVVQGRWMLHPTDAHLPGWVLPAGATLLLAASALAAHMLRRPRPPKPNPSP